MTSNLNNFSNIDQILSAIKRKEIVVIRFYHYEKIRHIQTKYKQHREKNIICVSCIRYIIAVPSSYIDAYFLKPW